MTAAFKTDVCRQIVDCSVMLESMLTSVFVCQNEQQNNDSEAAVAHNVVTTAETLHEMDVDDLLKYINGDNEKRQAKATTRKAAKRARQKQRKVSYSFMFGFFVSGLLGDPTTWFVFTGMISIKRMSKIICQKGHSGLGF